MSLTFIISMLSFSSYSYQKDKRANCENRLTKRWYFSPWKTVPVSSHGFPFRLSYYFLRIPVSTESHTFTNSLTSPSLHPPNCRHAAQSGFRVTAFSPAYITLQVTSVCLLLIVGSSRAHDQILSHFGNILRYRHGPQLFSFHKHNLSLSPFTFYTLETEAASLTETSVTDNRQNSISQKTYVFKVVTLTTSFSCLSLFSSVLSIFLWISKSEFRLFILNEFDQFNKQGLIIS